MVLFGLTFKTESTGLKSIRPRSRNYEDFRFLFKIKCTKCQEVSKKDVCITASEVQWIGASRFVNMAKECHLCESTLLVKLTFAHVNPPIDSFPTSDEVPIFDCKGCEPCDFTLDKGHIVESLDGTVYDAVDLSSGYLAADGIEMLKIEGSFEVLGTISTI